MKKFLLVLSLIFLSRTGFVCAQKAGTPEASDSLKLVVAGKNELKLNMLYGVLGIAELTYERVLGDNSGIGISVAARFDDDSNYKLILLPYYRMYFGQKQASGFFIEANAGLLSHEDGYEHTFYENGVEVSRTNYSVSENSFGIGVAAGGKFLNKNGFFGEAYLGLGRMFNSELEVIYPRSGITLGKRF